MSTNVPYSVKQGADLSDTIQVELRVHEEQEDMFENS